jgi:hypothetical protein
MTGVEWFVCETTFHPETPKQCNPPLGWGFLGVSRTGSLQKCDSKESV